MLCSAQGAQVDVLIQASCILADWTRVVFFSPAHITILYGSAALLLLLLLPLAHLVPPLSPDSLPTASEQPIQMQSAYDWQAHMQNERETGYEH